LFCLEHGTNIERWTGCNHWTSIGIWFQVLIFSILLPWSKSMYFVFSGPPYLIIRQTLPLIFLSNFYRLIYLLKPTLQWLYSAASKLKTFIVNFLNQTFSLSLLPI
jgi:hypothetical protein